MEEIQQANTPRIVEKPLTWLKPYANNPRHNDEAVEVVAASIEAYGFKVPIIAEPDGTIIAGHTRLKAAQRLRLKHVPVIIANDLTEAQARAFRLIENRAGEQATWDIELLEGELAALDDVANLDSYGFEELLGLDETNLDTLDDDHEPNNNLDRTPRAYNLHLAPYIRKVTPRWQIPVLEPYTGDLPPELIKVHDAVAGTKENPANGVHCFVDDYRMERLWTKPELYAEKLARYSLLITPDYSLYTDMSHAMQLYNVYRSRFLGAYWQALGLPVVPQITWADETNYEWCFDGTPPHATVAISTVGLMYSQEWREFWARGVRAALERLEPERVLLYGIQPDGLIDWPANCEVTHYSSTPQRLEQRR